MTYVSKGEKVFAMSHGIFADCSPPNVKRSDGRLKRFSSIFDDRVWSLREKERYRYLYDTMSGSQTCLAVSTCFKYVPLEEIINILLADRDAYIKCLEKKLGLGVSKGETPIDELYKAGHFEDEEELDALPTRNRTGALTAELEECKNTRDTLRIAMHKLENIDDIINENKCLKKRLRCSEEMIKYLEEKKSKLEKELENIRTKSQIQVELQNATETLKRTIQREQLAEGEDLVHLTQERDGLQQRVRELQHELSDARNKQSELELLKKQSQSATLSLEEITKENECYKKKLASMKCLEKQIQDLKKQANVLAEKYRRDSCRASDQDRKMKNISSELKSLREERDRLKRRVDELACYEIQYNSLQCKLQQIDAIITENEMLNCKLASLNKLEMENQYLRCKLEQCQSSELEAAESREKILELQNAVADQEEEMKDLLCQIERLTRAFGNNDELDCLKEQLCEKDCKLKLCEEQLAEIPLLEAEIDELRSKLENCCNNIGEKEMYEHEKIEAYEESVASNKHLDTAVKNYDENDIEEESGAHEELTSRKGAALEKTDDEKGSMTCEEIQTLLQSSKGIINCVLEDMIEHQREMEELEKCNQEMKNEICLLKAKMGKTDMDECLQQVEELRRVVEEKELKICCLETEILRAGDIGKVNDHINNLESEIEYLKNLNKKMRVDLEEACCEIKRCAELESLVEEERQTRKDFSNKLESRRSKSQKEEFNLEAKVSSAASINEVDTLKNELKELKHLVEEFKKENSTLREMQITCPDYLREMDEKEALENLLNLLQCELDSCRQKKIEGDCEDLKLELNRLEDQNCQLKNLVNCYKERLDLERCSREATGSSSSSCLQEENKRLRSEITRLRCELIELCKRIQQNEKKNSEQEDEIQKLKLCCNDLVYRNDELEKEVDEKDNESQNLKGELSKLLDQTYKLSSDNDVLKNRLNEAKAPHSEEQVEDYEKDLNEKHALESAMRNLEEEVDGLKMKLEECGKTELERNNLLKKQADMESEMEMLRKQLAECKDVKLHAEPVPAPPLSVPPSSSVPPPYVAEPKPAAPSSESKALAEAKAKEEKLQEEMVGMREQAAKLQAEVHEAKAENKKLRNEIDDLRKLLDQCNKEKAHEAAQASLMSSKLQGMSYPVPAQAQGVPQTIIPIKEEQRPAVYERGTPGAITPAAPEAKVVFIENQAPETLVKVVAEAEDFKKLKEDKTKPLKTKPTEDLLLKEEVLKPSKTAVMSPEKGPDATSAKAPIATPEKDSGATSKAPAEPPTKAPTSTSAKAPLSVLEKDLGATSKAPAEAPTKAPTSTSAKAPLSVLEKDLGATSKAPAEAPTKAPTSTSAKAPLAMPEKAPGAASKAPAEAPTKAPVSTSSKAPLSVPEKPPGTIPLKTTVETPSKAKVSTPSKSAVTTLSRSAVNVKTTESKMPKDQTIEAVAPSAARPKTEELTSVSDESVISFSNIDPDFAKFLCSLSPDNHKQNLCEIERRYKEKLCELQKKNDEKVRKLVEQHEKEAKLRDGLYNDNISTMRSSFETDIRKLVERHKASILRLQSLHEDEMQELNVNYEAEIEAIETQNDNMLNDLTSGARDKLKMLTEQHKKEIKELEKKYEELLQKKENEHVTVLSKLKSAMSQNIDRVEEYHNKTMSDMTMALEGNISDIQTKHNREFQKLKKSNLKRIDILKNKYEGLLMCERKKYEKQLEVMVQRLRQGKALADGICQCRFTVMCDSKDLNAPLDFNDVIRKILTEGLESLTFNEVALVHKRACAATEDIIMKTEVKAELEPSIKDDSCERNQILKVNKEEILNKIFLLENEIAIKQRETQDAIADMEIAVIAERKRLQDLRDFLRSEHGKGSEIILPMPKMEMDIKYKSTIDLQCMPVREKNTMQRIDHVQKENRQLPLVPEKENIKTLHTQEPQFQERQRKNYMNDCKPKHGGTTKKKLKK